MATFDLLPCELITYILALVCNVDSDATNYCLNMLVCRQWHQILNTELICDLRNYYILRRKLRSRIIVNDMKSIRHLLGHIQHTILKSFNDIYCINVRLYDGHDAMMNVTILSNPDMFIEYSYYDNGDIYTLRLYIDIKEYPMIKATLRENFLMLCYWNMNINTKVSTYKESSLSAITQIVRDKVIQRAREILAIVCTAINTH